MRRLNKTMLQAAARIAKSAHAQALLFNVDCLDQPSAEEISFKDMSVLPVTQLSKEELQDKSEDIFKKFKTGIVYLPKVMMTRMSHIKIAVVHAISDGLIKVGDKIVFVNGIQGSHELDDILLLDTGRESEVMTARGAEAISQSVKQEVFQEVLHISLTLAHLGREGKPVGTIFVLGDEKKVLQLSKQMVINPFRGYTDKEQNILNPDLKETIREFAAIDGAFIISSDGRVLSAGRYLNAASDEDSSPRGLGSRHIAAGGITALTKAVAIVISESSGDVRIYKDGKILMEVEKSPHL
jgi:diadenylate cyclase